MITLVQGGRRRPGTFVMMHEHFPCKVTAFSTAKPGKHGSEKAMIVAKDIFTGKQYEETFGTGDMIPAPIVVYTEYTCVGLEEGDFCNLLCDDLTLKEDLSLPTCDRLKDVSKQVRAIMEAGMRECLIKVQRWGDVEQIVSVREGSEA